MLNAKIYFMNYKILILDDDVVFSSSLQRQFERYGYHTKAVNQADAFIDLVKEFLPDIVILDLNLGSSSSLVLIEPIRQICPNVLIYMLTGFGSISTCVSAIKAGANDYLIKPIRFQMLLGQIKLGLRDKTCVTHSNLNPSDSHSNYQTVMSCNRAPDTLKDNLETATYQSLSSNSDIKTQFDALDDYNLKAEKQDLSFSPMSASQVEWEHIQSVLSENNGNISQTARQLSMHRRTLQRKLSKKAPNSTN